MEPGSINCSWDSGRTIFSDRDVLPISSGAEDQHVLLRTVHLPTVVRQHAQRAAAPKVDGVAINLRSGQELWGLETNEPLLSRPSSFHGLWKTLRAGLKLNFDKGKCGVYPWLGILSQVCLRI